MSGGAYDYFYNRIEEFADALDTSTSLRREFRLLLLKVAKAAHDIEWVDSGDGGKGSEDEAILAVLNTNEKTRAELRNELLDEVIAAVEAM